MVTIRQHGPSGQLFDLKDFIVDLQSIQRTLDRWTVRIDECIGLAAPALSELTSASPSLSPVAFAGLCGAVEQTVDGEFIGYRAGREIVRLVAVDSSFWEIHGPTEFERLMLAKYGAYES